MVRKYKDSAGQIHEIEINDEGDAIYRVLNSEGIQITEACMDEETLKSLINFDELKEITH